MFDQVPPPNNLPVESDGNQPPVQPPKSSAPPKPYAGMRGGIMPSAQHEPEDILSGVGSESTEPTQDGGMTVMEDAPSGNEGKLRMIMIVLASVAGVLLLGVGGLFAYRTFFVKDKSDLSGVIPSTQTPSSTNTGIPEPGQQVPAPQPESAPVVAPTPVIPDIPKPEQVGASSTSAIDTDGDGLPDVQEATLKTDPKNADTDGDLLLDGEEVKLGTDPLVSDTDGDGLSDGDEVHVWKTDPKNPDTDGDGFTDGQEIRGNYNPLGPGKLPSIK